MDIYIIGNSIKKKKKSLRALSLLQNAKHKYLNLSARQLTQQYYMCYYFPVYSWEN